MSRLRDIILAITARYDAAQASGVFPDQPLWMAPLPEQKPRGKKPDPPAQAL